MQEAISEFSKLWRSLLGTIIFYTICPIPESWQPSFSRIARWCPLLGLMLGGILSGVFFLLSELNTPTLLKSVITVSLWLGLTGGLHLDGAMDSADGLAVTDPQRRLEVMVDSVTGAFGVMNAIVILLLKVAAVNELTSEQWWLLPLILAWGRWSQVTAIAFYPYLKPTGKGAFHKQDFQNPTDLIISIIPITIFATWTSINYSSPTQQLLFNSLCIVTAIGFSFWFQCKFQGQTGDTYGATVEWTESILLSLSAIILQ
ncbi:MAG: adenosylcobinamide-GDP ribazoletransferase [Limnothrix sp.]